MAEIVISSGVVSSGISVGEDTQLIVESGGTVSAAFVSSFDCGPIVVESGGLAVSSLIEDGAELWISGTANNTTATDLGSAILFGGGVANNTMVEDLGTLEISGGVAVNTTVANGGEVYIYGGIASNTIVIDGYLVVYEEGFADTALIGSDGEIDVYGSAADITVNGGEMFIDDGSVVNGLTASSATMIYVDFGGKLTGQITLDSSPVTLTSDAVLDFDISAQAPGSAALLNDYSQVGAESGSVFTITVDANQAEGTYALAAGAAGFAGTLTVGTTDTEYGSVDLDDPLVYGDYTYTLTLTEGALDLTIAAGSPPISGMVLIDSTYKVESGVTVLDTQVSSGGSLIVSSGGLADSTTVNLNGSLTVRPDGTATNIVENGGWVYVEEGGSATFTSNTISGMIFESSIVTVHSGTTAADITMNSWGVVNVYDGGLVNGATVNPDGDIELYSGATVTNIIENGGAVQLVRIDPEDSATMTFLSNTFSNAVATNGRFITAHSGTTAVNVTATSHGVMEVYNGGVLRGLTVGSDGNATIQPGGKLTGSVTLDSNLERLLLAQNSILDFDISAQAQGADALLNDYSLITFWGTGSPTYTITVDAAQAVGTYALAANAAAFEATVTLGTADTEYGTLTVNGDALEYGDYTYTLTLTDGALNLDVAAGDPPISGLVLIDSTFVVSPGVSVLDTQVSSGGVLEVQDYGLADSTSVNPNGSMCVYSGGTATEIVENGGYVGIYSGASATFVPTVLSGLIIENGGKTTLHSATEALDATVNSTGFLQVCDGGLVSGLAVTSGGGGYVFSGGKVTGSMTFSQATGALYLFSGSILDFDISAQAPGSDPLLNDYSGLAVSEGAVFTITVDAAQAAGAYALAAGADGFAGTLTLGTADTAYGTITVNGDALIYGDYTFYLTLDSDALNLYVNEEPPVPTITGVNVYSSGELVSSAAEMTGETIQAYANDWMTVGEGGTATSTAVKPGGIMDVYSGGLATITTIDADNDHSATVNVLSGGTADSTTINYEADLQVFDGGVANNTTANQDGGLVVSSGGVANDTTLNQGGRISVEGTANGITAVTGGRVTLRNGGVANDITFSGGGSLAAYGGVAIGITAGSGASIDIRSGAKVTGSMTLETGAQFNVSSGGIVDFDISAQAPGAGVLVNDLSLISGSPSYTITVDAAQAAGAYALAAGADDFAATLTLGTADTAYGTITVNGDALIYGDYTFYLTLDSDALNLYVNEEPPVPPVIIPEIRHDLNGDGRPDIMMTISDTDHPDFGMTTGLLVQESQTVVWDGLSQLALGDELFGTGKTVAGKASFDVYVRTADNVIGAWTTGSEGQVTGWVTIEAFDSNTEVLGIGDFNGDGQSDLLLQNVNGAVGCYFTSGEKTGWNYFQSLGEEWSVSAIGDLNNDGLSDTVLRNAAGYAGTWLTQADGTVQWAELDTLSSDFEIVGTGDFNADGTDDVLLQKGSYFGAWLVKNGKTNAWMGLGDLGDVTVEQIADYNTDGIADLRVRTAGGDLGAQLVMGEDDLSWQYYLGVDKEWNTSLAALS